MPTHTANLLRFVYSLFCYVAGVASLLYFIGFVNNYIPDHSVNSIKPFQSIPFAIIINLFVLSLFAIQHSVMARKSFKVWLTQRIHPSIERSTYCLATAIVIFAMCYLWVPFGNTLWHVENDTLSIVISSLALLGWGFLFLATFMLNHFELFGLSQTFLPLRGKPMPTTTFKTPGLYRLVRHPIQTGVLIGMWAVPVATTSHALFALSMTVYIFIGLYFEEKDLNREFGEQYKNYQQRVKRLIPFIH
jgi:protein-S-isoprenylcysteine O-methyltransferase Ste14